MSGYQKDYLSSMLKAGRQAEYALGQKHEQAKDKLANLLGSTGEPKGFTGRARLEHVLA